MRELMQNNWKRMVVVILFYLINFGLWELIAPMVSAEWASFAVYVVLFLVVLGLFWGEMKEEAETFRSEIFPLKSFKVWLVIALVADLLLTAGVVLIGTGWLPEILPANNENVKNQMASVPLVLSVFQGCVMAPVIEEMTFRYGIIHKPQSRRTLVILTVIAIVLFDCFHIVKLPEFFTISFRRWC